MQKWQIRTSLCCAIRLPILSSAQCTFSTSQSRLDDDRPRSNRQASAKAGRLIADLAAKNARERSKDLNFGLRGLKPYEQGSKNTEGDGLSKSTYQQRKTAEQSGPPTIRKIDAPDRDPPTFRKLNTLDRHPPVSQQRKTAKPSSRPTIRKFNAPDRDPPAPRSSRGAQYADIGYEAETRERNQHGRRDMVQDDDNVDEPSTNEPIQYEWEIEDELADEFRLGAEDIGEDIEVREVTDEDGNTGIVFDNEEDEEFEEIEDDEEVVKDQEGDEDDGEKFEDLDPEDEDYAEKLEQSVYQSMEIAEKETGPGVRPYNPEPMKAEELHSSFIGLAAGELGIASAAKQAMGRLGRRNDLDYQYDAELANRLYRGEVVRFRDAEEKKRVVEMAEEFASNTANRIMKKKGEWEPKIDVGFVPVPEEIKEQLAGKAMRGLYPPVPSAEGMNIQEKTMAHLRKSVLLNETYSPTQGKSMVDFIAQMWPAEKPSQPPTSGKQKGA
jgi:hypothetical protein